MEKMLSDLKLNAQGYALLPSDLLLDQEGKSTGGVAARLVDVELMTSQGNRNIDIGPIIDRYQHDIARSVLSEFLMLGTNGGSYALSKSKTDLFLRALESYINTVADVLNKQLVEPLWELNGLPIETMPKIRAGDVAPHDLKELGSYLRNLNGANIDLSDEPDVINALLHNAELPQVDPDRIVAKAEERKELEKSKVAAKAASKAVSKEEE
jgi:phage gp29-like protein